MNEGSAKIFLSARNISTAIVVSATVLALILHVAGGQDRLGWQVALAIAALAIGIPHGAIDHLISLPTHSWQRLTAFIAGYVALAVVSGIAIFQWNVLGFQIIVLLSFLHFGFGDASFLAELRKRRGESARNSIHHYLYAFTSGALPVLLPLTSNKTTAALQEIHPGIINWAGDFGSKIRFVLFLLTALTLAYCAIRQEWRDVLDLIALLALSIIAPPLVAFAIYFGAWHAVRHTARLTSLLPKSIKHAESGQSARSFFAAVYPGLPALLGACALAVLLVLKWHQNFSSTYLWNLLVIVWALTVPHMMATARFDRKFLAKSLVKLG
jgi:Brp/Blh family beta-carotene 15,15'-monooxygenase